MAELSIYRPESQVYERRSPQQQTRSGVNVTGPKNAEKNMWDTASRGIRELATAYAKNHDRAIKLKSKEILDEQTIHNNNIKLQLNDLSSVQTDQLSTPTMMQNYINGDLEINGTPIKPYELPEDTDPELVKLLENDIQIKNQGVQQAIQTQSEKELKVRESQYVTKDLAQKLQTLQTAVNTNAYSPDQGGFVTEKDKNRIQKILDDENKLIDELVENNVMKSYEGNALKRKMEEQLLVAMVTRDYLHDPDKAVKRATSEHYKYSERVGGGSLELKHFNNIVKWDRYKDIAQKTTLVKAVLTNNAIASDILSEDFLARYGIWNEKDQAYEVNEKYLDEQLQDKDSMFYGTDVNKGDILDLLRRASDKIGKSTSMMDGTEFYRLYRDVEQHFVNHIFGDKQKPNPLGDSTGYVEAFDPDDESVNVGGLMFGGKIGNRLSEEQRNKLSRLRQVKEQSEYALGKLPKSVDISTLSSWYNQFNKTIEHEDPVGKKLAIEVNKQIRERIEHVVKDPAGAVVESYGLEINDYESIRAILEASGWNISRNGTNLVPDSAVDKFYSIIVKETKNEQGN